MKPILQNIDFGKLPPSAIDIECAILGAVLNYPESLNEITDILIPESFYKDEHQKIYSAILELDRNDNKIDILTVQEELRKKNELEDIGGPVYITGLISKVISSSHILEHARIIKEKYLARELIMISSEINTMAFDDSVDISDRIDRANQLFDDFNELAAGKSYFKHLSGILNQLMEVFQKREALSKEGKLVGLRTPLKELNKLTGGWRSELIIIAARPGAGKCLGRGTKILMYDGSYKCVENINKNDLLMGIDSKPRKVLQTCIGIDQMYLIKQKNGYNYRCNGNHILSLKVSGKDFQKTYGKLYNISVKDYFNLPNRLQDKLKGYKIGIEFEENNDLLIPPYLLGVWLADGSSSKSVIHNPDIEIEEYIKQYCYENNFKYSKKIYDLKNCPEHRITGEYYRNFLQLLRKLNILNNKHIPKEYLINSRKNRLELLAGLLDGDGYRYGFSYEISQKREILAQQILYLSNTLGFGTSISHEKKRIKSIDFEGYYYRLHISGEIKDIPCRINRKKAPNRKKLANYSTTYGVEIIKDKIDFYYGFELDGDGLFLLEDNTVTHNSAIALAISKTLAFENIPVCIYSLEMSDYSLGERLVYAEADMDDGDIYKANHGYMNDTLWVKIKRAKARLEKLPIYIDDNSCVDVNYIKSHSRIMKKKNLCGIIIIDYLQLASGKRERGKSKAEMISDICRELRTLRKNLDIPIIVLSQLNREVEKRGGDKRPQLSDIKESGGVEESADMIMFIHRPAYYNVPIDEKGNSTERMGELIISKNKNGPIDTIKFSHNKSLTKITDYSPIKKEKEPEKIKTQPDLFKNSLDDVPF
jgi:replicative DNA helicase